MAAGNVARIMRGPGRIVINPTDFELAYPYGGVEIGKTRACQLTPLGTPFRVESEALGEATDVLEANRNYLFTCFVRGWDDSAVEKLMSGGYTAGSVSSHAVYSEPGNVPGTSSIARAVILLYVPDDLINVNALLIYRGIPDFPEGAEFLWQHNEELGIPMNVDCLRDSRGNMLSIGRFADLSLT